MRSRAEFSDIPEGHVPCAILHNTFGVQSVNQALCPAPETQRWITRAVPLVQDEVFTYQVTSLIFCELTQFPISHALEGTVKNSADAFAFQVTMVSTGDAVCAHCDFIGHGATR